LLDITVFEAPDLNRTLRVSANGEISFQLLGAIKAGGLTPRQLELILQESLRRTYMKDPHVGVFVRELQSHPVSVVGAVRDRESSRFAALKLSLNFSRWRKALLMMLVTRSL
jgi:polysaccharide export outer membrane protein